MSTRSLFVPVALSIAVVSSSLFVRAQPVQPLVREGVTEKVSAHVHVISDASVPLVPNVGIVVGDQGVFVIDTGLGVRNGEAVLREVRKLKPDGKIFLATTHFHPEHDLGASAFPPDTTMLRSRDQQKDIDEFGLQLAKTFSGRSPFIAELLKGAKFRTADEYFEQEHTIDLGGVTVKAITMGANHTRGDTTYWIEADGILFSGDVVMRPQPSFASPYSTVRHWRESLDFLEKLKPRRIVPSHGPMGDAALIRGYRDYFSAIESRVADLKKNGVAIDDVIRTIGDELKERYPDRQRLAGAIRAIFQELR